LFFSNIYKLVTISFLSDPLSAGASYLLVRPRGGLCAWTTHHNLCGVPSISPRASVWGGSLPDGILQDSKSPVTLFYVELNRSIYISHHSRIGLAPPQNYGPMIKPYCFERIGRFLRLLNPTHCSPQRKAKKRKAQRHSLAVKTKNPPRVVAQAPDW
jgi:hypothetical protein